MVADTDGYHANEDAALASWSARKTCRLIWWVTTIVVVLGVVREVIVGTLGEGTPLRDLRHISLDGELNVATWYSSALMLAASMLTLVASRIEPEPKQRPYWLAIATVMLLMSIDETASFHESFITLLDGWAQYSDYLHFSWVVLGAPFVLLFAAFSIPFLLRLDRNTAVRIVIAGALFVFGALVLEMIDGAIQVRYGAESLAYRMGAMSEDIFELVGMTVFVAAMALHVAPTHEGVRGVMFCR